MKKIIIALDVENPFDALDIVEQLKDEVDVFKVGLELFTSAGPSIVEQIHRKGKKVFLDLKFHDIPTTVAKAAVAATKMGVYMFNVHASNGLECMKKCRDTVAEVCLKENLNRPIIIGVTVLTSMSQETLRDDFAISHSLRTHVKNLAKMTLNAGLDGVVASGHEASMIKKHCGNKFIIVTPGIRIAGSSADDQSRVMTPKEAIREGADFLVMGRSILKENDPLKALGLINSELPSAI